MIHVMAAKNTRCRWSLDCQRASAVIRAVTVEHWRDSSIGRLHSTGQRATCVNVWPSCQVPMSEKRISGRRMIQGYCQQEGSERGASVKR